MILAASDGGRRLRSNAADANANARDLNNRYGGCAHAFERRPGEPVIEIPKTVAAQALEKTTSWADYYRVTYATEDHRHAAETARKRLVWHRATHGYAMRVDESARDALDRYRMFLDDVPAGDGENFENAGFGAGREPNAFKRAGSRTPRRRFGDVRVRRTAGRTAADTPWRRVAAPPRLGRG